LLLDIVPNHIRTDCSNRWFADVLARGPRSRYASWFDIDWASRRPELRGKVLLPILEDHYAEVLEDGKLRLDHRGGKFVLLYHERVFPLNDATQKSLRKRAKAETMEKLLRHYNGKAGEPHSFDALDAVLQQQHYRLAHWRTASE